MFNFLPTRTPTGVPCLGSLAPVLTGLEGSHAGPPFYTPGDTVTPAGFSRKDARLVALSTTPHTTNDNTTKPSLLRPTPHSTSYHTTHLQRQHHHNSTTQPKSTCMFHGCPSPTTKHHPPHDTQQINTTTTVHQPYDLPPTSTDTTTWRLRRTLDCTTKDLLVPARVG